jgi:glycosyltransferase involved in cell wall biosynthesis
VVIPAFNAEATLGETLDSALGQTYPNVQVVVVDDGSTDGTAALVARYGPRVELLRQANAGLAAARNAGCEAARGEYIAILDADDLCMPERIGVQAELLASRPQVVLCCSEFSAFGAQGRISEAYGSSYYSRIAETPGGVRALFEERGEQDVAPWIPSGSGAPVMTEVRVGNVRAALARGNFVHPPTVMFRRSLLGAAGRFDESLRYACDWDWFVRASRQGPFAYIERALLDYRISPAQMSRGHRGATESLRVLERLCQQDPELYGRMGGVLRKELGRLALDAAEALADRTTLACLRLLATSLGYGIANTTSAKVLLKALLPYAWIARSRAVRVPG